MRLIILLNVMLITFWASAQSFSEKIVKELSFEKKSSANTIQVANINGDVIVTGYDGDKILIEVNKTVSGKTEARLAKGKEEVQIGIIDRADTLIVFVKDGCNSFSGLNQGNSRNNKGNGWSYNWNCNNGNCDNEYDYKMDFTIKVPAAVNVIVSTINEGDVLVEKMSGAVNANNINGSIRLSNLKRESSASTINGDLDIEYTANPQNDCRFYSLNGDINAIFQKGLAADLSFESFNGDFYTNIEKIQMLPARLEKSTDEDGLKYKIDGNRYQVGNGGVFLDFETFNGNVYLKEKE